MRYTRIFSTLAAVTLACGSAFAQADKAAGEAAKAGLEASQARDWNRAIAEFKRAADADKKYAPNLSAALQQRAAVYLQQQNFPAAIADYSEALKIKPDDSDLLERRAYAFMQLKDYDHALADYNHAVKVEPNDVKHYLLRSYIYEVKGDVKNGMADCDTALKLQPGNPEAMSRKMRFQRRMEAAAAPTPVQMPNGPIANPALQQQPAAPPAAATAKP
jgi:tetratricopeptide (TPR) repeat protein